MPELYPDDQEKVDRYISTNFNSVERKPFRPLVLLGVIIVSLVIITLLGWLISLDQGVV